MKLNDKYVPNYYIHLGNFDPSKPIQSARTYLKMYLVLYLPKDVTAFTDDNKGLFPAIIWIDVFQGGGDQFFGKFGRQPNG